MRLLQTICLLLVLKSIATNAQRHKLSTPEECAKPCIHGQEPRTCYWKFTIELYTTMNRACELCKPNSTDQLLNVPRCQCVEADGYERAILSINRMIPGPSIQVCEKDTIIVDAINKMEGTETSVHWHGIWQQGSQYYDGVPFLTQCPITSGNTFRYQFGANNPGTHFYHSHSGLQKVDGLSGALIVRQPQSVDPNGHLYDYDHPTHVIKLSDWFHELANEDFPGRWKHHPGQTPESILINGRGPWKDPATNKTTNVQIETFHVQPGKRYRFRIINSFASVCPAELSFENHTVTIIAQDGESVQPFDVTSIITFSGERVDVVVTTTEIVGSFWIQLRGLGECGQKKINQLAVLRCHGGPEKPETPEPTYDIGLRRGVLYNPLDGDCNRPRWDAVCVSQLKSVRPVPPGILKVHPDQQIMLPYKIYIYDEAKNGIQTVFQPGKYPRFLAAPDTTIVTSVIDGISAVFPEVPPISQRLDSSETCNGKNLPKDCGEPCYCPHTHHIKKDAIVEIILYEQVPSPMLAHPFHLHGYVFWVMEMGNFGTATNVTQKDVDKVMLEYKKKLESGQCKQPPAKDTIAVPQNGYAILRFKADNPGWWLFHCHFSYHISIGMNLYLHVGEQRDLPPVPRGFPTCGSFTPRIA